MKQEDPTARWESPGFSWWEEVKTTKTCPLTAIEAAVAELEAALPAGAVLAVVVEIPGHRDYRVASPSGQCPAATYGMLHDVVTRHGG